MEVHSLEQIVEVIRRSRKRQGITQEQVADYTGLQRVGVVRIEAGKTEPKVTTLLKICQILGIKIRISEGGLHAE